MPPIACTATQAGLCQMNFAQQSITRELSEWRVCLQLQRNDLYTFCTFKKISKMLENCSFYHLVSRLKIFDLALLSHLDLCKVKH
jgi:hypothetical protein